MRYSTVLSLLTIVIASLLTSPSHAIDLNGAWATDVRV